MTLWNTVCLQEAVFIEGGCQWWDLGCHIREALYGYARAYYRWVLRNYFGIEVR